MRDFMPCKGCDEPEACEIEGRCLEPSPQPMIRTEPVKVDLSAELHPTLYVLHPDGSISPAELVCAAGSLQGKISDEPVYIEVSAEVRYWEDATVNGTEDSDGGLIPFKRGDLWCPVIRLRDGVVMDWPAGTTADIHYKVCDAAEYWLLNADRQRIAKWADHYVPDDFLCHGDNGYGDYIIFKVSADGLIQQWREPAVEWAKDEESESSGWKRAVLCAAGVPAGAAQSDTPKEERHGDA